MTGHDHNRRKFFKNLAVSASGAVLASRAFGQGGTDPAPSPASKFVPDTDPTAKALGYVPDGTKADRQKKGETEGKDQFCSNCQLFTAGAAVDGKEAGKCLMLPSGAVTAKGWCKSWVKKP